MRVCPTDHRHEATASCYNHHRCRCEPCREAKRRRSRQDYWRTKQIKRADVKVPVLGAQRRLQALAVVGWSPTVVAQRLGMVARNVSRIREAERAHVMLSTHRKIDAVYRELSTVEAPGHSGVITRAYARKAGWVSALAWDDIDDPSEVPSSSENRRRIVDRELLEWLWRDGLTDPEIAEKLGCTDFTVFRIRREMGLEKIGRAHV